ncbi:MAG: OsmC family protein [Candidatus Aminicenantia bacterium]
MKAKLKLVGGMQFVGTSNSNHSVVLDSDFEGEIPAGNKPMELVLISLGGCTGMDVISIMRKKRQEVTCFAIEVTGKRVDDHPRVFKEINIKYIFKGNNLSPQAIERAIQLSQEKYCSVSAMLKSTAQITTTYEILE